MRPRQRDDDLQAPDPQESEAVDRRSASSDELDIEKKWLQLTRIDPENFETLYNKYRPKIFRFLVLSTHDRDLASELTDETFSRAVDGLGSFRWQGYSFGAWLFRIARNVMGQEFRRRRVRREVPFDGDRHDQVATNAPDRDMETGQEWDRLADALASLDDVRREVFVNHYGLDMTTREIGIVMSLAEGTVKSHLQRGRKQLLRYLVEHGLERGLTERTRAMLADAAARDDGWDVVSGGAGAATGDGKGGES